VARKKTFLLNHELIDGIRFLNPEQFKAIICGLSDLDERKEPETKDPVALAFINMQKGFILENAEKWEKKCASIENAREERANLDFKDSVAKDNPTNSTDFENKDTEIREENSEIRNKDTEIRNNGFDFRGENSEISSVTDSDSVSDPVSEKVSVSENDKEFEGGQNSSSSGFLLNENASQVWETIRETWNNRNCRFTCDKIYLNLSYNQQERVRGSMATYTPKQMVKAINKYFDEREKKPNGYEYKSFYLFVEKGMEFYVE
jgi:E3 ubiquitin-protein ligase DOA10